MKPPSRFNRLTVVLLVFAVAAVFGFRQQAQWRRLRQREAQLRDEFAALQAQRSAAEAEAATRRRELAEQGESRAAETARLAKLLHQDEGATAETLWSEPPARVPDWNPASPYVWLRKESLSGFPVRVFDDTGRLGAEVASVLVVSPETVRRLNDRLSGLLEDLHAAELANAKPSDEHLPDIAKGSGRKLTVRISPLPEEGARLRQEFEAALREHLGAGRAELVLRPAGHWLDSQFNQTDSEPRILSVARQDDGTYHIAIKAGFGFISVGGQKDLTGYVPAHLRPLFAPLTDPKP